MTQKILISILFLGLTLLLPMYIIYIILVNKDKNILLLIVGFFMLFYGLNYIVILFWNIIFVNILKIGKPANNINELTRISLFMYLF